MILCVRCSWFLLTWGVSRGPGYGISSQHLAPQVPNRQGFNWRGQWTEKSRSTCTTAHLHLKSNEIGSLQRGSKSMNYTTHTNLADRAQRTWKTSWRSVLLNPKQALQPSPANLCWRKEMVSKQGGLTKPCMLLSQCLVANGMAIKVKQKGVWNLSSYIFRTE